MVEPLEIECLLSGICRPLGIAFAIRRVSVLDDEAKLRGMAEACLIGKEQHHFNALRSTKRRTEFISGRLAARAAIGAMWPDLDVKQLQIIRESTGAPRVEGVGSMGLSISHSGSVAVAVAAPFLVGVDLEMDEIRPEALSKYFLSDIERRSLPNLSEEGRSTAVNRLWTRKEAACKVGGWGGSLTFAQLDCTGSTTTIQGRILGLVTESHAGYVASVAYERHSAKFDDGYATSFLEAVRVHG